jgi:toxin-antitoxin system PIN domain toxin
VAGVVDTNVLLYAANQDAPEHAAARAFLLGIGRSADAWYLTEGIVYEFLRVATHPKVFPSPLAWSEALAFLRPLVGADNVHVLQASDEHWTLLADVLGSLVHPAGNLFFDVRTVVLMREHGVRRIYTTDADFLQFAEIEVENPLHA